MRSELKIRLNKNSAEKFVPLKKQFKSEYGIFVSNKGRVIQGLPEDIDTAAEKYKEIKEALYYGQAEYV